jgi:hypothetical protein
MKTFPMHHFPFLQILDFALRGSKFSVLTGTIWAMSIASRALPALAPKDNDKINGDTIMG